jgi:pyruvate/2-oxoglutarate dehydrogenase complex dihydrolipoamide dehydrogenase (E3) component
MAVEYDVIILGGTPAGAIAADRAVRWGARVAWVWQGNDLGRCHRQQRGVVWGSRWRHQADWVAHLGLTAPPTPEPTAWSTVQRWAAVIADLPCQPLTEQLTVAGVDILPGVGQVVGDRPLQVAVGDRVLSSRSLLLALAGDSPTHLPRPLGEPPLAMADGPYLTVETLVQQPHPPRSLVVLGQDPGALALAPALAVWGTTVTVVTAAPRLLPGEDGDVAQWLTAQLQGRGIEIVTGVQPQRLVPTATGVELTWGDRVLGAAALLLALPRQPDWTALGPLAAILQPSAAGVTVNRYLQTRHPRIFACGGTLGGYDLPAIQGYEATVAIANALFWPRRPVDYAQQPYSLDTTPTFARVGLTEAQARRRYGTAVRVYRAPWHDQGSAHWGGITTGFCKLVTNPKGQLLGAHLVGPEAPTLVQGLAWAKAAGQSLGDLARGGGDPDGPVAMVQAAIAQYQGDRWQPGIWRRDWAENWCHWRRSR